MIGARSIGLTVLGLLGLLLAVTATAVQPYSQAEIDAADIFRKDRCTALAVGKKASTDASTMTTHTDDCADCDFRVALIKGKRFARHSKRPVAPVRFAYPRYLGYDRGDVFTPERLTDKQFDWKLTQPIGHIPQVEETYTYLDGSYALVNEHQVAFGESTCSARLINKPVQDGGKALFDISELSRVAAERAKTAREAIRIMGDLAVEYGYYGAEWTGPGMYGEAGETLTVSDREEAWVFHILPDGTDASAVWVAQRVPDDHIAVVANEFIIGELDLKNKDYFMASKNVYEVAKKNKFWNPEEGPFNFRKAYSEPAFHTHRTYSDRRNWRVMDLVAPSLRLPSNSSLDTLPFSVKPDALLSPQQIMAINRDHYEGTEFDLTRGLAAGPFGNPNRYDGGLASGVPGRYLSDGNFERAISIHRTVYSTVTQSRGKLPDQVGAMVWFGNAQPHATCFVPFYPFSNRVAPSYEEGSLYKYRRESAWWAFGTVGNYMEKSYVHMSVDVKKAQTEQEDAMIARREKVEKEVVEMLENGEYDRARHTLSEFSVDVAENAVQVWKDLFEHLLAKYNDGGRIDDFHAETFKTNALFYPLEWLKAVGYFPADMAFDEAVEKQAAARAGVAWVPSTFVPTSPAPVVPVAPLVQPQHNAMACAPSSASTFSFGLFAAFVAIFAAGFVGGKWNEKRRGGYSSLDI